MKTLALALCCLAYAAAGCGDGATAPVPDPIHGTELTVREFGAIPSDGQDDTQAIQMAINAAQASHAVLRFEPGSYSIRRNLYVSAGPVTLRGSGAGTVLDAATASTEFETLLGLLVVGLDSTQHVSQVRDLIVEDLAIDGHFLISPIYCTRSQRCLFHRITAANSNTGVCRTFLSQDITYDQCTVSGGRGIYGDGVMFGGVTRPAVLNCSVSDFTRIGICTEQDTPVLSEEAMILHNTIHYAHDSTYPESNAAIWLENTNGGIISNNLAWDLDNSPGKGTASRGITLGLGTTRDCWFTIRDNHITRATIGVAVNCGPKGNVIIDGLELEVGDHFDYADGVHVGAAGSVVISNSYFGDVVWTGTSSGTIVIDLAFGLGTITVRDCRIGARVYGANGTDADILLYNLNGNTLENLALLNLHGWRVKFNDCPSQLFVKGCDLNPPDFGCAVLSWTEPGSIAQGPPNRR